MKIADCWNDYRIIATGDGMKLEKWGGVTLLRPDPQVIWHSREDLYARPDINAVYHRSERAAAIGRCVNLFPNSGRSAIKI